jgi:MarR family 2-MHQ and catechol resistance regulon transcriptional repressor
MWWSGSGPLGLDHEAFEGRVEVPPRQTKSGIQKKDSGLEADARELQAAVSDLVRIYQFRDRTSICYYDISVTQCYALVLIVKHGPMTLNKLASELYLDKSTASRVVGALVKKGYASRSTDREDARALSLESTRKGRELESKIQRDLIEEMKRLIADFGPNTRQATARLIARLARAASEKFGGVCGDR